MGFGKVLFHDFFFVINAPYPGTKAMASRAICFLQGRISISYTVYIIEKYWNSLRLLKMEVQGTRQKLKIMRE